MVSTQVPTAANDWIGITNANKSKNKKILFFITVLIETARARALYITMFSGILGFYLAELLGMLTGLVAGLILSLLIMFRLPKDNILFRFWYSIWQ